MEAPWAEARAPAGIGHAAVLWGDKAQLWRGPGAAIMAA